MTTFQPSILFVPELKDLLARRDFRELKRDLQAVSTADLAEGWLRFAPFERILIFKLLPTGRALELFEELEAEQQIDLLASTEFGALGPVWEELGPEEAGALFHRLPERAIRRMAAQVRRTHSARSAPDRVFPSTTAGGLMHTDFLPLGPRLTAQQALDQVRASSRLHRMGDLHVLYVVDDQGRLSGALSPRALIAAPRDMRLHQIMSPVQLIRIRADMDQEEAAKVFAKYKLVAAPVVDQDNRLMGVLTVDDMLHVMTEEATEDIAKMAGTSAAELEEASPGRVARLRMPWLVTTCVAEVLVGYIVFRFEATLAQAVALASFMPLIAAMGGNVGTQSSTLCVRGLATGHLLPKDAGRLTRREFLAGFYMGSGYGAVTAVVAALVFMGRLGWAFPVVVGLGVLFSMTTASTVGAAQPFLLRRLNIDPAVAVGPLVTTLTDLLSVSAYLTFATVALTQGWLTR